MLKTRLIAIIILILGLFVGNFVYTSEIEDDSSFHFKLGLDLSGGTHLVYRADLSLIDTSEKKDSMEALRDVIERRVNLFGVGEPLVQVERTSGLFSEESEERLIVELPGITDVDEAVAMIGKTPFLEFRLENDEIINTENIESVDLLFVETGLTGRFIESASISFDHTGNQPRVLLDFNKEGKEMFADITRDNVGKLLAIYLDGAPISTPIINEEIRGGSAEISGNFTPQEAKELVGRLNSGALPVPIELLSSQTIGASLGEEAKTRGVMAGIIGLIAVAFFMKLWYRLQGVVAIVVLFIYILVMLALFKIIPVTLTSAGIAGFILSVGMAVDANVLIFERIKEEIRKGGDLREAIKTGFDRAWLAIRDSNISSIITAIILFWFGTSLIKGFALVFGIGVIMSMLTAITITRTFLLSVSMNSNSKVSNFLFGSGIK